MDGDGYEPPAKGYAVGTQSNATVVYATYAGGASAALTKDADGYVADDSINQASASIVYAVPLEDGVPTASPVADGYEPPADGYAVNVGTPSPKMPANGLYGGDAYGSNV